MAGGWACWAAALVPSTSCDARKLNRVAEPYLASCIFFGEDRDWIGTGTIQCRTSRVGKFG